MNVWNKVIDLSNFQIYPTVYDGFVDVAKSKEVSMKSLVDFLTTMRADLDYQGHYFEFYDFFKGDAQT